MVLVAELVEATAEEVPEAATVEARAAEVQAVVVRAAAKAVAPVAGMAAGMVVVAKAAARAAKVERDRHSEQSRQICRTMCSVRQHASDSRSDPDSRSEDPTCPAPTTREECRRERSRSDTNANTSPLGPQAQAPHMADSATAVQWVAAREAVALEVVRMVVETAARVAQAASMVGAFGTEAEVTVVARVAVTVAVVWVVEKVVATAAAAVAAAAMAAAGWEVARVVVARIRNEQ